MRKLMLLLALLGIMTTSIVATAVSADEAETVTPETITYTFGGENGAWETDADNSTGIWSYYHSFGTIDTIQAPAMTLNDAQDQYSNGEAYFAIRKDGFMHPGASGNFSNPIVGLKVEKSGTMVMSMSATKPEEGGNGTVAKFLVNNDAGLLVEKTVATIAETTMTATAQVTAGDMVYFLIHHAFDIACDGATYVVTYTLTEKANDEPDTPVVPDEPDTPVVPDEPDTPVEPVAPVTQISGCDCGDTCDHTAETCYCASNCECANCASFQGKVEGDVEDVNNIDDFRFVQGAKGFSYLYGKVSEGIEGLAELSVASTNWDTAGVLPYLAIRMDGLMHPGMTDTAYMVALAWTAEKASTVDVYFDAIFESVVGNNGDGVTVGIYLNNTCLNSFALNPAGFNEESNPYAIEFNSIKVNEGDVLYFTVSPNETLNFDGVLTYVEISWAKEADIPADSGNTSTNESASENTNEPATSSCGGSMGVSTAVIGVIALAFASFSKKRKEN